MESIFDLPAHPLMVHFPVVAIPVLTAVAIAVVVRPAWRSQFRLPIILFVLATVVSTILAAGSGEALADATNAGEFIDTHRSLGEMLRLLVIGLGVALLALLFVGDPNRSGSPPPPALNNVLGLVVVALAVLSLIWVVRTGHEGSKVHWDGYLPTSSE